MRPSNCWTERARRLARRIRHDDGSASIEFLTVGMLLLLPLIYLVLVMAQLQAATLAVEGATRQAARIVASAQTHGDGLSAADAAIVVALADVGIDDGGVEISCSPNPSNCITAGGTVDVAVTVNVAMPLVPPVLGLDAGLAVPIDARASQPVSDFASTP